MTQRLYGKYNVTKTDGSPVDPNAQYFVLRIDTDEAARQALDTYAKWQPDPVFREQLLNWLATTEKAFWERQEKLYRESVGLDDGTDEVQDGRD
jgi:hypothetical protein